AVVTATSDMINTVFSLQAVWPRHKRILAFICGFVKSFHVSRSDPYYPFMTPCHTNKRKKGKLKRYYYYRCTSTFKKDWHNCAIRQVNANRLENYIFDNLDRISLDKHYLDSLIFRLNSPVAGDRIGLEPSKVCSESPTISSEIVSQTLRRLTKSLVQKRGIEKNLFIKKFIKSIIYSTNSNQLPRSKLRGIECLSQITFSQQAAGNEPPMIQVNLFSPPREKEKTGAESAGKIVCNEDMAPRVGLEPTTYWLQLPPSFLKDWTISFPS
ncbi:MAG: zinc ribbon domain-containing protein, partial [Candidatus Omnitrophica bacterium]|nr:zinc ribbon domain-containing protein [Candidatus Omnitrophota bacterium]